MTNTIKKVAFQALQKVQTKKEQRKVKETIIWVLWASSVTDSDGQDLTFVS